MATRDKNLRVCVIPVDYTSYDFKGKEEANIKAFSVLEEHSKFKSIDGILYSVDERLLIRYPPSRDGAFYFVPDSVVCLCARCLSHVRTLATIYAGLNTKAINQQAFASSFHLRSVEIGPATQKIASTAFSYCEDLEEIIVVDNNPFFTSVSGCLFTKDLSTLIYVPAKVKHLPDISRCRQKYANALSEWEGPRTPALCALPIV